MKAPLYAIYVTLAVVIAVVLLVVMGEEPDEDRAGPRDLDRHIILVLDTFGLETCDDLRVVGSYRRTDAQGFQSTLAYSAPAACIVAMRDAAIARGFAEGAGGRYELDPEGPESEALTFYGSPGQPRGAFEWERTGQ